MLAAIAVAVLILGAAAALVFSSRSDPRFSVVSANDGVTVWRLDNRTGQISVCGSALAGAALAQAETQLSARIRGTDGNRAALAALAPEKDEIDSLSRPRCSPWSEP